MSSASQVRTARNALTVFFMSGMLMSFPGAILPAWGYHLKNEFLVVGNYFLSMALGILLASQVGGFLQARRGVQAVLTGATGLASVALLWMAASCPPAAWGWRAGGLFLLGVAAGLLNRAAFQSISFLYEQDPAATLNMAGVLFGLGCLSTALLVSMTFYMYAVSSLLVLMAVVPGFGAALYWKARFAEPVPRTDPPWRQVWEDVRSPGAVMFTLLLFFQSGNEWAVAGWLAVFLVQRVGVSPVTSLMMLAAYWLALLVGRVVAQALLPRVGHGKLLLSSAGAALLGSLILAATNNRFGAWTGILLLGSGFAMIYPLVVEKIGHRFRNYHPGFFNGIFSFGMIGALAAPWSLGFLAHFWGVGAVMIVPFVGTCTVFLLLVLIWAETKLTAVQPASHH